MKNDRTSKMTSIRICKQEKNFVKLNKEIFDDSEISLKLKGFLGYCFSHDPKWHSNISQITKFLKIGKTAFQGILKEGIESAYIKRFYSRSPHGRFLYFEYIIYDIWRRERDSTNDFHAHDLNPSEIEEGVRR